MSTISPIAAAPSSNSPLAMLLAPEGGAVADGVAYASIDWLDPSDLHSAGLVRREADGPIEARFTTHTPDGALVRHGGVTLGGDDAEAAADLLSRLRHDPRLQPMEVSLATYRGIDGGEAMLAHSISDGRAGYHVLRSNADDVLMEGAFIVDRLVRAIR